MCHITRWVKYSKGKLVLQIEAALFYYKLGQALLQIGAASSLQIGARVVTNWGSYYNLGQPLLQNRAAIILQQFICLFTIKRKTMIFISVKKIFIEIRLCNRMRHVFKGHVKMVKIYMVKFNASILKRLKTMVF